jgi:stage II sporulation protein D
MNLLATLALTFIVSPPAHAADRVRISLFTLFRPEAIEVRVASPEGAVFSANGHASDRSISRGDLIRIRLSGSRLEIVFAGSSAADRQSIVTTEARIVPKGSATIELSLPGRIKRSVRGDVSIDLGAGGRGPLRILLTTDREAAVASVVAAEIGGREPEAVKALAVVVRTFVLSHPGRHSNEGFDFCDTTHCQFYRGERDALEGGASVVVANAVRATQGQFLTFEGRRVEGYYSAACGGISATPLMVWGGDTDYSYSRVVCRWCRGSRFSRWERSAGAGNVLDAVSVFIGTRLSSTTELITDCDQSSGFVRSIAVRDGSKRTVLSADGFRRAIGLKLGWNTVLSPTFTVERRGSRFVFRGRGFGSQIGLCEAGAIAQAAAGRSYREIVRFYFPGTQISEQLTNE